MVDRCMLDRRSSVRLQDTLVLVDQAADSWCSDDLGFQPVLNFGGQSPVVCV